jgi:hypothetical protein
VGPLKPVGDYINALVHPSARRNALTAACHRACIAPRVLGSVLPVATSPTCVTARGVPSALEMLPIQAKKSEKIVHPTFERVTRAGRYLEKKSA